MTPRHPADWIALSLLPGLGPISLNRLLERYPDPHEIAFDLPAHVVSAGTRGASAAAIRSARRNLRRRVDEELRRAGRAGVRLLPRAPAGSPAGIGPARSSRRACRPPRRLATTSFLLLAALLRFPAASRRPAGEISCLALMGTPG